MNLRLCLVFTCDCHTDETWRHKIKSNFHSAGKWMDHGHLEMKGEEHNIMKVSNWLITKEITRTTKQSLLLCKLSVCFLLILLKLIKVNIF